MRKIRERLEEGEEGSHTEIWGKSLPDTGSSNYKGLEQGGGSHSKMAVDHPCLLVLMPLSK